MTPTFGTSAPVVGDRVEAEDADRAAGRPAVALEALDRRRLARAVRPEHRHDLAAAGRQRQPVDRRAGAVADDEVAALDGRIGQRRLGHTACTLPLAPK